MCQCLVIPYITRTCLYNVDPLEPRFYIVKLGFTGVYIIFLFPLKNIDCGYSLEPPRRGGSNEYPQSMFRAEIWKISEFLSENFHFLVVKFSIYLNWHVFVMFCACFGIVCSSFHLLVVSREVCASWLKHFLGIFMYIFRTLFTITKTRLFKYIEILPQKKKKNENFQTKNVRYFFIFLLKT